jgi:hypothetical protein
MAELEYNNSISGLTSQTPEDIIAALLSSNSSINQVLDAVFACLSQRTVPELLALVESSALVSKLKTLDDLIKSKVIAEMDVKEMLREMFSNFSNSREGIQNLIAVSALLVLLSIDDNEKNEELKALIISSLFHDDIVVHLMNIRDEKQQHRNRCPSCVDCNARFILSIGWYVAAQDAHNVNAFLRNEG